MQYVINAILYRIQDNHHLGPQMAKDPVLEELVRQYNGFALNSDADVANAHYAATGETYGREFKRYLARLPSFEQMRLLETYLERSELLHVPHMPHPHTNPGNIPSHEIDPDAEHKPEAPKTDYDREVERDERKQKHWLIRVGVISALIFIGLMTGLVIAITWQNKTMPDNALVKTLMTGVTDVLKVLFGIK